jgi:hypothetical protein
MKKIIYFLILFICACNMNSEQEIVNNLRVRYYVYTEVFDSLYKEIIVYKKNDEVAQIELLFNGDLKTVTIFQTSHIGKLIERSEVPNNNFTIARSLVSTLKGTTLYFYFVKGVISLPTDLKALKKYGNRTFLNYHFEKDKCDNFFEKPDELPITKLNSEYFICNNLSIKFISF